MLQEHSAVLLTCIKGLSVSKSFFFVHLRQVLLYSLIYLQDFEALTPNLLARTVETVEGGGIVVVLLKSMNSLKQLYAMTMVYWQSYNNEKAPIL